MASSVTEESFFPTNLIPIQVPVVQMLDSSIHWINHYPDQQTSNEKANSTIHWRDIYPVDSAIQPLKNRGQTDNVPPTLTYF